MMGRLFILGAGLVLFAVLHTLLATDRMRHALEVRLGEQRAFYRLLYNALSLAFLLALFVWTDDEYSGVWDARGALRVVLWSLQGLAVLGFLATLRQLDLGHFIGVRQVAGEEKERGGLRTNGTFALCRHPLYFFVGVFFLASPTMDLRWLVITIWIWAYAWIGSWFEERKLLARFGEEYRMYQTTHPRLVPRPRRRRVRPSG